MADTSSGEWGDEIDRAMLSSMATSFRARMGFSFNADDMAELMLRCAALFAKRDALKADVASLTASLSGEVEARMQAEAEVARLVRAGDALSVAAQTTGGVAGRDEGLMEAVEAWTTVRATLGEPQP